MRKSSKYDHSIQTVLSSADIPNVEVYIYPTYVNNKILEQFTPQKFRELDSSDASGIALKVFTFAVCMIGGMHLHNPLFNKGSMPDTDLLSMGISSLEQLSNRGKVYLPKGQFPHIDPQYFSESVSVADWIEDKETAPKDNPYYKNGYTRIPSLKNNWSIVYIISPRSPEEAEEKGLDHGYITLTRNDAVQLSKLIKTGEFTVSFADEYLEKQEGNDIDDSSEISLSLETTGQYKKRKEYFKEKLIFEFDDKDLNGNISEEKSEKSAKDINSESSNDKNSNSSIEHSQEEAPPVVVGAYKASPGLLNFFSHKTAGYNRLASSSSCNSLDDQNNDDGQKPKNTRT